jgi:hypothetical protein
LGCPCRVLGCLETGVARQRYPAVAAVRPPLSTELKTLLAPRKSTLARVLRCTVGVGYGSSTLFPEPSGRVRLSPSAGLIDHQLLSRNRNLETPDYLAEPRVLFGVVHEPVYRKGISSHVGIEIG